MAGAARVLLEPFGRRPAWGWRSAARRKWASAAQSCETPGGAPAGAGPAASSRASRSWHLRQTARFGQGLQQSAPAARPPGCKRGQARVRAALTQGRKPRRAHMSLPLATLRVSAHTLGFRGFGRTAVALACMRAGICRRTAAGEGDHASKRVAVLLVVRCNLRNQVRRAVSAECDWGCQRSRLSPGPTGTGLAVGGTAAH